MVIGEVMVLYPLHKHPLSNGHQRVTVSIVCLQYLWLPLLTLNGPLQAEWQAIALVVESMWPIQGSIAPFKGGIAATRSNNTSNNIYICVLSISPETTCWGFSDLEMLLRGLTYVVFFKSGSYIIFDTTKCSLMVINDFEMHQLVLAAFTLLQDNSKPLVLIILWLIPIFLILDASESLVNDVWSIFDPDVTVLCASGNQEWPLDK